MFHTRKAVVLSSSAACLLILSALAGCATPGAEHTTWGMHATRATIYSSVADLAADSSQVIVATVTEQHEATDRDLAATVSTVTVTRSLPATDLGKNLASSVAGSAVDSTIEVRQMGASSMGETPAPLLAKGGTYLLFLTPSMMDGEAASQFYITGGDAGIFTADSGLLRGSKNSYGRLSTENPDKLPLKLTDADLLG